MRTKLRIAQSNARRRIAKSILASAVLASLAALPMAAHSEDRETCRWSRNLCIGDCEAYFSQDVSECDTAQKDCKAACKPEYEFCEDSCKRDRAIEDINCNTNHTSCSNDCQNSADPVLCARETCDPVRGSCLGNSKQIFDICKEDCKYQQTNECEGFCDGEHTLCKIAAEYNRDDCVNQCNTEMYWCMC
jgi:hypothetical protein